MCLSLSATGQARTVPEVEDFVNTITLFFMSVERAVRLRASLLCICLLLVSGAVMLGACSILPKGRADFDVGIRERGIASWYGEDFHGWVTASGELYDMYALTAAHRALPLGTVVRVVNAANGKQVQVRINDRGPYVHGRILDLSFAAASTLGMVEDGVTAVYLEVVAHPRIPAGLPERGWLQSSFTLGSFDESRTRGLISQQVENAHHRSYRPLPSDMLRERRVRRVADILAADRRVEVVAALVLA